MKLAGPIRKETAQVPFRIGERQVMVERMYDPSDPLELLGKSTLGPKLTVLSIQLKAMGSGDEDIERLARKLVALERLSTSALSSFMDAASMHIGGFRDPLRVICSVAEYSCGFQPDSKGALLSSIHLFKEFASLSGKEEEERMLSGLRGN